MPTKWEDNLAFGAEQEMREEISCLWQRGLIE